MKTIGELLKLASHFLEEKGMIRAGRDAEELLGFILGCKRLDLFLQFDRPLEEGEIARFRGLIKRRATGEPIDYILGEIEFFDCRLKISPAVLIPRPETEVFLQIISERIAAHLPRDAQVWDLCCGSGCLGLGLKKKFPFLEVTLTDLSKEALVVAKKNALENELVVTCLEGDLWQPLGNGQADLIVCNPPYVAEKEYAVLSREVKDFEPRMALTDGADGLTFYRRLAREITRYLRPGGHLCLEIGSTQKEAIDALFCQVPNRKKSIEKDWAGHDRFFFLEIE